MEITLDELLFANFPSPARAKVIEASVVIERIISVMLQRFLNIEEDASKSFQGNSRLSFNHQINLLTDMSIITSQEKTNLIKFTEIRNLFAHNSKIWSFIECYKHFGLQKYLVDKYKDRITAEYDEERNIQLFDFLFDDVKETCRAIFKKMMDKAHDEGKKEGFILFHHEFMKQLQVISENDLDFGMKVNKAIDRAKEELK